VTTSVSPENTFDRLLGAMPRIAAAVNQFKTEENQRAALDALVRAIGLADDAPTGPEVAPSLTVVPPLAEDVAGEISAPDTEASQTGTRKRHRRPSAKRAWQRAKDVNFRPDGKMSLREFATEKDPGNNDERNAVIVYYLEEILSLSSIDVSYVLAGYTDLALKAPSDPDNALRVTASKKGWLDTSDMKTIRITHPGRNAVEHDMPRKKKVAKPA
jgi:hypothetical protein